MNHFSITDKKISLSLILCLFVSGCNFSKVNRVDHEPAIAETTPLEKKQNPEPKVLDFQNLKAIYERTLNIKTADDALSVIKDLEAQIIKTEVITDPSLNMLDSVTSALGYYTTATLRLLTLSPDSEAAKAQSDKFVQLVSLGCSTDLENCKQIRWIKRDSRTHTVLTLIAKNQESKIDAQCSDEKCDQALQTLFKTISLSFATNNQIKDVELYMVFSKRIHQYAVFLDKKKDKEGLQRQGLIFDSILANLSSEEDQKIILPIVKMSPPWNYSRKSGQFFNFGTEKLFTVASKNLLYENGKLSPDLKKSILDEQKNPENKESIYNLAKYLNENSDTKDMFKALNFDISPFLNDAFYDEYFYILNRFTGSHLNYSEAEAVWQGSKKNITTLVDKVREIAKIRMIGLVVKTNQYFSLLLQTNNLPSNRLFIQSIDDSGPLNETWGQYFSELSKVSNLLGQFVSSDNVNSNDLSKIASIKDFLAGTKRNAKFLSVYPNMLNLGYFMIKLDASFTTRSYRNSIISIDPKTMVNALLDGNFAQPWYLFSGDLNPINKSEIILAFDYALRLGSFEIFAQAKDEQQKPKIDRLQFFKALKSTMDDSIKRLNDTVEEIENLNSDPEVSSVINFCSQKNLQSATPKIKLDDFEQFAVFGTESLGTIGKAFKLYSSNSTYYRVAASTSSVLNSTLRSGINSRLLQLKAMSLPLLKNIKTLNISDKEKVDLENKINAEIDDVTEKLKSYYLTTLHNHRLLKDCTQEMVKIERDRQMYLINSERKYLESTYDHMLAIFNENDSVKKSEMAKQAADQLGFVNAGALMAPFYKNSKYNLLKRFEKYSNAEGVLPKVEADEVAELVKNRLETTSIDIQFLNLETGLPIDKASFVKIGLSKFNSQGSNTVQWFRTRTNTNVAQIKLESMIAIYKLGYDLGLQSQSVKFKNQLLKPITSLEIAKESLDFARSLSITPEEEKTLRQIGQFELYPMSDLVDYYFDSSETKFNGVLDNVFLMATRSQEDLAEATRYYQERINTKRQDAMIFPMAPEIEESITGIYKNLVEKDEMILADFRNAVRTVEKQVEQNPIRIVYRLFEDSNAKKIYTSDLVQGHSSILVDKNKIKASIDTFSDFHNRLTFRTYMNPASDKSVNEIKKAIDE